jgi:hypothetical protein
MSTVSESRQARSSSRLRRIWALMRKESFEVVRDPSSIALGIVMPTRASWWPVSSCRLISTHG